MKSIAQMQSEVIAWATRKGWHPAPERTFGDECALLHSEVSEALEAFRTNGFEDFDDPKTGKPEGVGRSAGSFAADAAVARDKAARNTPVRLAIRAAPPAGAQVLPVRNLAPRLGRARPPC